MLAASVGDDFSEDLLPFSLNFDPAQPSIFTDELWTVLLIDNDDPLDNILAGDTMFGRAINPVTSGTIDPQTGIGDILLQSQNNDYTINLRVQIIP